MQIDWLFALLFLPLFPCSAPYLMLLRKLDNRWLRALALLIWPQLGAWLLSHTATQPPALLLIWAVLSALFYALRALSVRELNLWLNQLALSSWALGWLLLSSDSAALLPLYLFAFSVPLVLLALLSGELEQRFEAAFSGLCTGLAHATPRLALLLLFSVLAVTATPIFPAFFALLAALIEQLPSAPWLALALLLTWLLWSWAAARLLQGLLVGEPNRVEVTDLSLPSTLAYSAVLLGLTLIGLSQLGGLL